MFVRRVLSVRPAIRARTGVQLTSRALATAAEPTVWNIDNPYTGALYKSVPVCTLNQANAAIDRSATAYQSWKKTPLAERKTLLNGVIASFEKNEEKLAVDITSQMGKPIGQARGEVKTAVARMKALIELSDKALADEVLTAPTNFSKRIKRESIGPVLALCPWNYPLLCAVNTVATAVLSGNSVLIKMSDRTALCADHFVSAFRDAGANPDLVQSIPVTHPTVAKIVQNPKIAFVSFTGSVNGGRAVYSATAAHRFIDVGLELGGKDAAYVAADANVPYAIENVVDGALYNAGQSCCSVERVYVHSSVYDQFVTGAHALVSKYVLGDPMAAGTMMGPLAQPGSNTAIAQKIANATKAGAQLLVGGRASGDSTGRGRFLSPAVLVGMKQEMALQQSETFGPVVSITRVTDDEHAIRCINDSPYGLTASVWTNDVSRADRINAALDVGTVYMNRCDYLDPYLPWSGRKDSGNGIGLSHHAFASFTRTKGYNYKTNLA